MYCRKLFLALLRGAGAMVLVVTVSLLTAASVVMLAGLSKHLMTAFVACLVTATGVVAALLES